MSSILFYDPVCQQPYDTRTLQQKATGGTEASLTRIADGLGAYVMQHNRTEASGSYLPPGKLAGIEHVVLTRDSRALPRIRDLFPQACVYLWLHDLIRPGSKRGRWLASTASLLREMGVRVVCVSDTQRRDVEATLRQIGVGDEVPACTIYNPVPDELRPDGTAVDRNKLVFFSSPNKGLAYTLDAFRAIRRALPEVYLCIGNPGYRHRKAASLPGVQWLGPQPQERIHSQVRSALCTFTPNFVIPETFGLVFAESHAVGTPVLTHDCGAAVEIVGDRSQILPLSPLQRAYEAAVHPLSISWRAAPARLAKRLGLFDDYIERIGAWRTGARPSTGPDPRFRLTGVLEKWRALLG
ncbi:MAG TPA: glycosyltransferase family 4 protein [Steroidobacteraceae bacterium]|nr:glycosyltransferase family 4 protein [Steroidobacteraceae bacterium]